MKKKKKSNKKLSIFYIIVSIIIIILLTINVLFINKYLKEDKRIIEEVQYTITEGEYNPDTKYYSTLNYKNFKKVYKKKKVSTIAIIDNSSKTYNMFLELINKISFYKSTKIQLLDISKLSRKNEIDFYNLDERLPRLNTNYLITVSNNKILSVTTFTEEDLITIVKGIGE